MEGSGRKRKSYRIPSVDLVEKAIRSVLDDAFTIRSQTLFHRLVLSRIKKTEEKGFKLSPRRLRKVAAQMSDVDLIIHCREGDRASNRTICPVCGTVMIDIKNSTLYGWTVATGKACQTCSYWSGSRIRIPTRYVFTIENERYLVEKMEDR